MYLLIITCSVFIISLIIMLITNDMISEIAKSMFGISGFFFAASIIVLIVIGIWIPSVKLGFSVNAKRNELYETRASLLFRLDNWNTTDNTKLMNDIAEYNKEIKNAHYYLSSNWSSWFINTAYSEFEVIEYEGYVRNPSQYTVNINSGDE